MNTKLRLSACCIVACLLVGLSALGASANDRPNVIVIMADDKCDAPGAKAVKWAEKTENCESKLSFQTNVSCG